MNPEDLVYGQSYYYQLDSVTPKIATTSESVSDSGNYLRVIYVGRSIHEQQNIFYVDDIADTARLFAIPDDQMWRVSSYPAWFLETELGKLVGESH